MGTHTAAEASMAFGSVARKVHHHCLILTFSKLALPVCLLFVLWREQAQDVFVFGSYSAQYSMPACRTTRPRPETSRLNEILKLGK